MLKSTPKRSTRRRIERDLDRAEAAAERETLATLAHAHQQIADELAAEDYTPLHRQVRLDEARRPAGEPPQGSW